MPLQEELNITISGISVMMGAWNSTQATASAWMSHSRTRLRPGRLPPRRRNLEKSFYLKQRCLLLTVLPGVLGGTYHGVGSWALGGMSTEHSHFSKYPALTTDGFSNGLWEKTFGVCGCLCMRLWQIHYFSKCGVVPGGAWCGRKEKSLLEP
jgi:hypothetical protein